MRRFLKRVNKLAAGMAEDAAPSRIVEIPAEQLSPEQRTVVDAAQAGRGWVPTPFKIWLHSPQLAAAIERLGTYLVTGSALTEREIELATTAVARHWHGTFVHNAHANKLLELGVPPVVVEALAAGRRPVLESPREQLVVDIAQTAERPEAVDDTTFAAAIEAFGHAGMAELLALLGYYSAVALAMKTYRVPPPPRKEARA